MKIINVKGNSHYFSGRLSIGLYVIGKKAIIIDSGLETYQAKQLVKELKKQDIQLIAIINTHSHADHCGGNHYLQSQFKGLKIYATSFEKPFIENPFNEPYCFCGSAEPCKEFRNKFLEAKPSIVTDTIAPYKDQEIYIENCPFRIITLQGHTPGMIGVITPDDILYCGDAIFGKQTFSKHGVLFYTNIYDTLNTFKKLINLEIAGCVLYHGAYVEEIKSLAKNHAKKVLDTQNCIRDLISKKRVSLDDLTQQVINIFGIPQNVVQYTLTKTCVNAYIANLQKEGRVSLVMINGGLCIEAVGVDYKVKKTGEVIELPVRARSLNMIQNYSVTNLKFKKKSILSCKLYFTEELTGEFIKDSEKLQAVHFLIDLLKFNKLAKNTATIIRTKEDNDYYRGIRFDYCDTGLGPMGAALRAQPDLQLVMYKDYAEVALMQPVNDDYISRFENIIQKTNIEHKPTQVVKMVQD